MGIGTSYFEFIPKEHMQSVQGFIYLFNIGGSRVSSKNIYTISLRNPVKKQLISVYKSLYMYIN